MKVTTLGDRTYSRLILANPLYINLVQV